MKNGKGTLVVTLLMLLCCVCSGFKQELWVLLEDGKTFQIDGAVRDMEEYRELLLTNKGIHEYCARGLWLGFKGVDYGSLDRILPHSVGTNSTLFCGIDFFGTMDSVRHAGAADTSQSALSLYSGPGFSGEETLVQGLVQVNIRTHTLSLVSAGASSWTLFEGIHLDGNWTCFQSPAPGQFFHSADAYGPIKTIGSVFKGCDQETIRLYKERNGFP